MHKSGRILLAGMMALTMAFSAGTALGATAHKKTVKKATVKKSSVVRKAVTTYPIITRTAGTYTVTNVNKVTKVASYEKITIKPSSTAALVTLTDLVNLDLAVKALGGTVTVNATTNVATIVYDGTTTTLQLIIKNTAQANAQKVGTAYFVKASVLAPKLVTIYGTSQMPVAYDVTANTMMRSKVAQVGLAWASSVHNKTNWEEGLEAEAINPSCAKCHNGYVASNYDKLTTTNGQLVWKEDQADGTKAGTAIVLTGEGAVEMNYTCAVCHAGRVGTAKSSGLTPVLSNGYSVRGGAGAACMTCHEGRNKVANYNAGTKTSVAPHHSVQTDLLMGTMGYKYIGTDNAVNGLGSFHGSNPNSCVGCHMSNKTSGAADHTMQVNGAIACGICHANQPEADRLAFGDYDGNKVVDNYTAEVKGLEIVIRQAIADKIKADNSLAEPVSFLATGGKLRFFKQDTSNLSSTEIAALLDGTTDITWTLGPDADKIYRAAYNVLNIEFDGSNGLHNPAYTIRLLQASYKDLTGNAVPNAQLR